MKALQFEAVLPVTGRFLSIREPMLMDYFAIFSQPNPTLAMVIRCAKLDGEDITLEQINSMELRDAGPLLNWFAGLIQTLENKGVA
jgi:hypothetical protein